MIPVFRLYRGARKVRVRRMFLAVCASAISGRHCGYSYFDLYVVSAFRLRQGFGGPP
jgi:hypothetical protein